MGEKRIRGRPQKEEEGEEVVVENEGKKKKSEAVSGYEQFRDQRIKENMERLQKLGILDLSRKLKPELKKRPKKDPSQKKPSSTSSDPPRRSSRYSLFFFFPSCLVPERKNEIGQYLFFSASKQVVSLRVILLKF